MRKLVVFNNVSLDGYFTDRNGGIEWAHERSDAEWNDFTTSNAGGPVEMIFGRKTYEMMASFWPTPAAAEMLPEVARAMNESRKYVFSRSLRTAAWQNTTILSGDLPEKVRALKAAAGPDLLIMGSGTIIAQLTDARLIDGYQIALQPVVLGAGRTMFEGVREKLNLTLTNERRFKNGNVVLWYERG